MSHAVYETYNVNVFLLINTLIEEKNLRNVNLKSVYNLTNTSCNFFTERRVISRLSKVL